MARVQGTLSDNAINCITININQNVKEAIHKDLWVQNEAMIR